jgi:hypothetical protein
MKQAQQEPCTKNTQGKISGWTRKVVICSQLLALAQQVSMYNFPAGRLKPHDKSATNKI